MKKGYILREVSCQNCGIHINVQPNVMETLEGMAKAAADLHRESTKDKVCLKPKLINVYFPALVSNEVFHPTPPPLIVTPNGNARSDN